MSFTLERLVAIDEPTVAPSEIAPRILATLAGASGGVLVRGAPHERAVLDALPPDVPIVAVLPDMARLLRDASEQGLPRAAVARLRRGGIGTFARLAVTGVRHLPAIARQDFAGLIPVLVALERGALGRVALAGVALAAPLTDLMLASGYGACLASLLRFVHGSLGVPAGFETVNLGHLLPRLAAWRAAPDFVLGPINPQGFRMKPSPAIVRAEVRSARTRVFATEATAGGLVAAADAHAFAREVGAAGIVVTTRDLVGDAAADSSRDAGAP